MRRVLQLAEKGRGKTRPNPMVGAVIIKNGRLVGEGYHKKAGGPHAEISALKQAGIQARGAEMYVSLEPCCHHGRTPPCTEAIIQSGIKKVYVGVRDANPLVAGKGIRRLKKMGIEVHSGILKKECLRLNEVFFKFIRTNTPFVYLKSGMSLDGKIATTTGESQWITGPQPRALVHKLRNEVDAILVGAGTVVKDNPSLTTRLGKRKGRNPVRVVLDPECKIPLSAKVFANCREETVIYASRTGLPLPRKKSLSQKKVLVLNFDCRNNEIPLQQLMLELGRQGITSVLIEGGSQVNASALRENIVDKVMLFMAPLIIGGASAPGVVGGPGIKSLQEALNIKDMNVRSVGRDFLIEGYL